MIAQFVLIKDLSFIVFYYITENPWCPPYFEDVAVPCKPNIVYPVENTQELLQEFENVFNTVNLTHLSPQVHFKQDQRLTAVPYYSNHQSNYTVPSVVGSPPSGTTNNFVQQEIEFVDDLVRARCQDLTVDAWPEDDNSSSSLSYSSGLSPRSESVDSCFGSGSGFSDEEFIGGRRAKPYDRPVPDEKRSRKKEQNKNAATRYRQKKKQEVEEILVEEKKLSDVNDKLAKDYGEVRREVKYLKSLMRELFKSKGLLD